MSKRKAGLSLLLAASLLLALPACGTTPKGGEAQPEERGKTVAEMLQEQNIVPAEKEVNGVWYGRNRTVSAYLLIGVDKEGVVSRDDLIGGQCDLLELLVLDGEAKTYTIVQLDRDTMAEVEILDYEGEATGVTTTQQICFAHTYGNGTEASCENVVRAVSRLFGGVEIQGYAALQYSAVPALNDALGGIAVTIEDDFSAYDPSLVQGETVTLTGEQALHFVRGRMSIGDGLNPGRMRRQRAYLDSYTARLSEELSGSSAIVDTIYNAAKPYMVTDMSLGAVSNLLVTAMQYQSCGTVLPEGELQFVQYQNGNEYAEFHIDPAALERLTLDLFYSESNEAVGEKAT